MSTNINVQIKDPRNLGLFPTEAALIAAYPNGVRGDYAYIGETSTYWFWDTGTSAWVDSGGGAVVTSVAGKVGDVLLLKMDIEDFEELDYLHTFGDETAEGKKTFSDGTAAPFVEFIPQGTIPPTAPEGAVYYDTQEKALVVVGDVTRLQIGQEQYIRVINKSGAPMLNGQVVYISGASGARPRAYLADNSSAITADKTIGILTMDIPVDGVGFATTSGIVNDLDTSGYTEGDLLYLGDTPGSYSTTKPTPPRHTVIVGTILYAHNNQGKIYVHIDIGMEFVDNHDVLVTAPAEGELPAYDASTQLWKNDIYRWNDIFISSAALGFGAVAPSLISVFPSGGIKMYAFAGNVGIDELYGGVELLHDWKEGTPIRFHIHWMPTTNAAGNVLWQLEYGWADVGATFSAPVVITPGAAQAAGGVPWANMIFSFGDFDATGKHIGSQLFFRLFRDAGNVLDTYPDPAALIQVGVHYQIDSLGSRNITSK